MFKVLDAYMQPEGLRGGFNPYLYRVYSKPEAREIYMKAQWAEVYPAKRDIYRKMGEYTLVEEYPKSTIKEEFSASFKKAIKDLKNWYLPK